MSIDGVLVSFACWLIAAILWWAFDERRMASPLLVYLIFHFISFVFRPWQISQGLDEWIPRALIFNPTNSELLFALMLANIGLLCFTAGALAGGYAARSRPGRGGDYRFPPRLTLAVMVPVLVLAAISMIVFGSTPFYEGVEYMESVNQFSTVMKVPGFIAFFHNLIPGIFAALIIVRGFRWWYVPPLAVYLILRMWVGWSRFTYFLGAVLVMFAYMAWRNLRWPTRTQTLLGVLLLVAFLSGKDWGKAWLQGGSSAAYGSARSWLIEQGRGNGSDFNTYDMLVGVVRAVPEQLPHTGFRFYLAPFVNLVPRAVWPAKPIDDLPSVYLNKAIHFGTSAPSLVGETYIGFGVPGVAAGLAAVGFLLNYAVVRGYAAAPGTAWKLFGVVIAAISIQVFRDGVYSITYFVLFHFGAGLIVIAVDKGLKPLTYLLTSRRAPRSHAPVAVGWPDANRRPRA